MARHAQPTHLFQHLDDVSQTSLGKYEQLCCHLKVEKNHLFPVFLVISAPSVCENIPCHFKQLSLAEVCT